jgi:hypothetical protein
MIAPMLLEAGGTGGGVGYSKIYLMFVNVVKSIMLLVGALGPKTVQTVVVSAILTSFCLGAVTIGTHSLTRSRTHSHSLTHSLNRLVSSNGSFQVQQSIR